MADETETTIEETLAERAQAPAESTTAGMGHVKEHSLPDLIEYAKFKSTSTIKRRVGAGIRFVQGTPGGSA